MPDFDRIVSVKRAAEARLLGLPGVHAVGVGPKLVGGQSTGELAIKVYLVRKKPADALAPSEIIPPEIDGVKTDVIEMEVPKLLLTEQDTSKERPLILGTATMAKNAPERGTSDSWCAPWRRSRDWPRSPASTWSHRRWEERLRTFRLSPPRERRTPTDHVHRLEHAGNRHPGQDDEQRAKQVFHRLLDYDRE